MKRFNLLLLFLTVFVVQNLFGQEPYKLGTYSNGGFPKEIRALTAEGETGVFIECEDYFPDLVAKGDSHSHRKIWFCLEQNEIPVFVSFLNNLKTAYTLLFKNATESQFIEGLRTPNIGQCIVANFEEQDGFMPSERGFINDPYFYILTEKNLKNVFFKYQFLDNEIGEHEREGKYVTDCYFLFYSPEDISSLINSLNNILPQHLRIK